MPLYFTFTELLYHKKWHKQNYFGIFPKLGGTINLWFDSTTGSVSHLQHPATTQTKEHKAINKANFFIVLFLLYIMGAKSPHIVL